MKKLLVALALTIAAATAAPASADVGISIRVGEPGFYGQLDLGDRYYYGRPPLIYSEPVIIERCSIASPGRVHTSPHRFPIVIWLNGCVTVFGSIFHPKSFSRTPVPLAMLSSVGM